MFRFIARRPSLGLEITASGARAAVVRRRGAGLSLLYSGTCELPAEMIIQSFASPSVQDASGLTSVLRSCLSAAPVRASRAALSLPDGMFRVLIFDFDKLPQTKSERERLIRWRLQKAAAFDANGTILRYEALHRRERGFTVLACMLKKQAVDDYEGVLSALDLDTWTIGPSSLNALNFYLPVIAKKSQLFSFNYITADSFATVISDALGVRFYRFKEVKRSAVEELKARLVRELENSLHFYAHMDRAQITEVKDLYLTGDSPMLGEIADELRAGQALNVAVLAPADVFAGAAPNAAMSAALGAGGAL
jgi:Tfp pilus assembly PilM family ATPase